MRCFLGSGTANAESKWRSNGHEEQEDSWPVETTIP